MKTIFTDTFGIEDYIKNFHTIPPPEHKEEWVSEYKEMSVHTRAEKPVDTLLKKRPNEEPEIMDYRIDTWEAVTTPAIKEALDSLYRIFNQMAIQFRGSEQLKEWYVNAEIYGLTFQQFISKVVLKYDIDDPNGIAVVLPSGEGVYNDAVMINPVIELFNSAMIKHKFTDLLTVLSTEKSLVKVNSLDEYCGNVYYVLTKTDLYKLIQYGNIEDETYMLELWYSHNIGYLPYITLGGDLKHIDCYESFFSGFKAFGNIAISQFSDWNAVMTMSSFPIIEEMTTPCTNIDCKNGRIFDIERNAHADCPVCKGQGYIIPMSPFNIRLRKQPDNIDSSIDAVNMLNIPSRRYITPPVDVVRFGLDAFKEMLKMAKQSLHLVNVEEAQSGVAKEIDREDKYSMLLKISDNLYDNIILGLLEIVEGYVNPINPQPVEIIKPLTFDLKSESDLLAELKDLQASEAPQIFVAETVRELIKKRFQNSTVSNKIFQVLSMLDPLLFYSSEKKNQMLLSGVITKQQLITSVFAYAELMQWVNDNTEASLLNKDTMFIVAELQKRLSEKAMSMMPMEIPEIKVTPDNMMDENTDVE